MSWLFMLFIYLIGLEVYVYLYDYIPCAISVLLLSTLGGQVIVLSHTTRADTYCTVVLGFGFIRLHDVTAGFILDFWV